MKNLKLPLFYSGNFKVFKSALGKFILTCLPNVLVLALNNKCPIRTMNFVEIKIGISKSSKVRDLEKGVAISVRLFNKLSSAN